MPRERSVPDVRCLSLWADLMCVLGCLCSACVGGKPCAGEQHVHGKQMTDPAPVVTALGSPPVSRGVLSVVFIGMFSAFPLPCVPERLSSLCVP